MKRKRFGALLLSATVLAAALPVSVSAADEGKVIYETDFEDGDVSAFTNRGGDDTTEISASTEAAASGTTSLLASGRSKDWNGPAFRLDDKCEPYTEYYISAKLKGRYYTNSTFSMQYTDTEGQDHYSNLVTNLNGSDWISVENVKVSFTSDMTNVFVYFEGGQDDLFIDDFSVVEVPETPIETDLPSLAEAFGSAFKIGTAMTPSDLSVKSFMNLLEKHFYESITVGNELKPDSVLNKTATQAYVEETGDDTVPQISFAAAKPVLDYCSEHKIPVRVHTLVWHSQTPDWFFKENFQDDGDWVDSEKMLKRMENYIKVYFETLTELYPDIDFYACDVVNEAWTDSGTPREPGEQGSSGSAKSAWVQVFGDNSFIEPAFTFARKYAPQGCKLYYNDYNEYMPDKVDAVCQMALDLKKKGVIDGIGMQSHLDVRQGGDSAFPTANVYSKALDRYAETGLDIQVTELDATVPENSGTDYFEAQGEYYKSIFDAIIAHADNISAVIFWGIQDDRSWRASQQPLIFDAQSTAKPAFYSILESAGTLPPSESSTTSQTETTTTQTETTTSTTVTTTDTTPTETTLPAAASLYGDLNLDGAVTLSDAVLLSRLAVGDAEIELSDEARLNADTNSSPGIDQSDLSSLLRVLAGLIEQGALPE